MGRRIVQLRSKSLLSERFVAILPKRHPLAGRASLRPTDLREEPFVFTRERWAAWPTIA